MIKLSHGNRDEAREMIQDDHKSRLADMEFVRQLMREPLLEPSEEKELTLAWRNHRDEDALHQIIRAFSRLVISIAVKFRFYGIPLSDIIQEGNIGLLCAADRFDPERNVRFSTYAKWWIRATIQDYVLRNWSIVRTGSTTNQKQLFFNLRRLKSQLLGVSGDHLSDSDREEIAETLHVTIRDVEEMEKRLFQQDLSLSTPISEKVEQEWQEFIPDERPDPESVTTEVHDDKWRKHWLDKALDELSTNEKYVITHRRLKDNNKTLSELGKEMKLSTERIRQIENRAMRKMRHVLLHHINEVREIL